MNDRTFERRRLCVYVAGPISQGDVFDNIMLGLKWGRRMLFDGLAPYIPHLDAYLTLAPGAAPVDNPSAWNALLEWDLEWVAKSDALFRIPGYSKGADLEADVARKLGIPVFEAVGDTPTEEAIEASYKRLMDHAEGHDLAGKRSYHAV